VVSVQVFYKSSGKPAKGAGVSLSFNGIFSGGVTKKQFADSDGNAHFDTPSGSGKVFVDGKTVYEGRLEGRTIVYI